MACFFCSGACGFGHETLSCLHGPWALSIYNTVLVGCLTSYGIYAIKAISCNQAYLYCFSLLHTTFGLAIPGLLKPKPEIQACCYRRAFIDYTSFNSSVSQYCPLALLYSGVSSRTPHSGEKSRVLFLLLRAQGPLDSRLLRGLQSFGVRIPGFRPSLRTKVRL